jgi:hypothetical protein
VYWTIGTEKNIQHSKLLTKPNRCFMHLIVYFNLVLFSCARNLRTSGTSVENTTPHMRHIFCLASLRYSFIWLMHDSLIKIYVIFRYIFWQISTIRTKMKATKSNISYCFGNEAAKKNENCAALYDQTTYWNNSEAGIFTFFLLFFISYMFIEHPVEIRTKKFLIFFS